MSNTFALLSIAATYAIPNDSYSIIVHTDGIAWPRARCHVPFYYSKNQSQTDKILGKG